MENPEKQLNKANKKVTLVNICDFIDNKKIMKKIIYKKFIFYQEKKNIMNFRLIISDVLSFWGPIDEEMTK
jgi:hypothetical protein